MKKAAFVCNGNQLNRVYAQGRRQQIEQRVDLFGQVVTSANLSELAPQLAQTEVLFSTWGMLPLRPADLDLLPALKALFYAAGSVQGIARPLLERGILVVSSWGANAVPVAEFTVAQIVLSNKGYFANTRDFANWRTGQKPFVGRGNFGATVAILGAGQIGRRVIALLRPYELRIVVYDPYLSEAQASELGVEKVTLEEAFEEACVVTNHLANLPATVGLLQGRLFESMRQNSTFINTGRGATVAEAELIDVLRERRDIMALLDVAEREPPAPDSALYSLPNVQLSSHIAGSVGDEVVRLADYVIAEFDAWEQGRPLQYAVSLEMLETMA